MISLNDMIGGLEKRLDHQSKAFYTNVKGGQEVINQELVNQKLVIKASDFTLDLFRLGKDNTSRGNRLNRKPNALIIFKHIRKHKKTAYINSSTFEEPPQ